MKRMLVAVAAIAATIPAVAKESPDWVVAAAQKDSKYIVILTSKTDKALCGSDRFLAIASPKTGSEVKGCWNTSNNAVYIVWNRNDWADDRYSLQSFTFMPKWADAMNGIVAKNNARQQQQREAAQARADLQILGLGAMMSGDRGLQNFGRAVNGLPPSAQVDCNTYNYGNGMSHTSCN